MDVYLFDLLLSQCEHVICFVLRQVRHISMSKDSQIGHKYHTIPKNMK